MAFKKKVEEAKKHCDILGMSHEDLKKAATDVEQLAKYKNSVKTQDERDALIKKAESLKAEINKISEAAAAAAGKKSSGDDKKEDAAQTEQAESPEKEEERRALHEGFKQSNVSGDFIERCCQEMVNSVKAIIAELGEGMYDKMEHSEHPKDKKGKATEQRRTVQKSFKGKRSEPKIKPSEKDKTAPPAPKSNASRHEDKTAENTTPPNVKK